QPNGVVDEHASADELARPGRHGASFTGTGRKSLVARRGVDTERKDRHRSLSCRSCRAHSPAVSPSVRRCRRVSWFVAGPLPCVFVTREGREQGPGRGSSGGGVSWLRSVAAGGRGQRLPSRAARERAHRLTKDTQQAPFRLTKETPRAQTKRRGLWELV